MLKEYDIIVIGTGSAMAIVYAMMQDKPDLRVAVIDKDEPGGICLTKGCIPSKILLYPAELVRTIERTGMFGIDVAVRKIDFAAVMERMRTLINQEIGMIRESLFQVKNLDYYADTAEFTAPYMLKVGGETIKSGMIFLCTGSRPLIPAIKGLKETGYLTSDTVLKLTRLPLSIAVIGGGYIGAEYGHFFSAMGSKVTLIGRNPQLLPDEEPEISLLLKKELQGHMTVLTNHEVREAQTTATGLKKLIAINRDNGGKVDVTAEEILVAAGRGPNTDILRPEKGGIRMDKNGWIAVNEYMGTSQPNVWALGDADGKHPFKHVANYESQVVFFNAAQKKSVKVDYHAVPHAVFTYPEVASVGLREKEVLERIGDENLLIGIHRYEDTAKGEAMGLKNYFAKIIVEKDTLRILGAHIIGPQASVLIQEVVDLMYTPEQNAEPILRGMHIHPALSEVVGKAFDSLMTAEQYHHLMENHFNLA